MRRETLAVLMRTRFAVLLRRQPCLQPFQYSAAIVVVIPCRVPRQRRKHVKRVLLDQVVKSSVTFFHKTGVTEEIALDRGGFFPTTSDQNSRSLRVFV